WGAGDLIVFAPAIGGPLQIVSANGGEPRPATTLDPARGHTAHRFPAFLPDGRHFLYVALPAKNLKFDVFVGSIDGGSPERLEAMESAPVYTEPGYVLFSRKDVLVAQQFDAGTRRLIGEPVAIGDAPSSVGALFMSGRAVSASTTGVLAYLGDRLPNTKLA